MKIKLTCIALLVSGFSSLSQAATIVPVTPLNSAPGSQGDGDTLTWVNSHSQVSPNLVMLGKWTPNNNNNTSSWSSLISGVTSANFTVTPDNSTNPATAAITWNLTGTGYGLYAILGSQSSSLNLNSVTNDRFIGSGSVAAPGNGNGWSHISFYGKAGSPPVGVPGVPDGGTTLAFFGVALFGLGSMRRLLAAKA